MAVDYLFTFLSHDDIGTQNANTICVHDDGDLFGSSPSGMSDALDEVDSWLTTKYRALLPSASVLDVLRGFRIPAVYGDPTDVAEKAFGLAGTLGASDGQLPREVCCVVGLRTNSSSRRKQGRLFLPSTYHSGYVTSAGVWLAASAHRTSINTFFGALLAGHDTTLFHVGAHFSARIYSRQTHKEGVGDKTTDIKRYVIRARPHWLERRQTAP